MRVINQLATRFRRAYHVQFQIHRPMMFYPYFAANIILQSDTRILGLRPAMSELF